MQVAKWKNYKSGLKILKKILLKPFSTSLFFYKRKKFVINYEITDTNIKDII